MGRIIRHSSPSPPKKLGGQVSPIPPGLTLLIYVDDWKHERVIPIHKSEDKPIAIVPAVTKVFEREVFRQLYGCVSNNSMSCKFQSGFRPKTTTLSALIQVCDSSLRSMGKGQLNCIVFLDIKKAFDS